MVLFKNNNHDFSTAQKAPLATNTNLEAVLILVLLLLAFIACLDIRIFQMYFYQSIGYFINTIVIMFCFFIYIVRHKNYEKTDLKLIAFTFLLLCYCVLSAVVTNGGMRYVGTVFNTVVLTLILKKSRISFRAVYSVCAAILLIMILIAFDSSGYYDNQFVQDKVNSNYIAQLAVAGMVYVNYFLCFIYYRKYYRIVIVRVLVNLIAFYILWECQSRGAFLAITFFLGMFYVFPKKVLGKNNFITIMSGAIAICGVLMTYLYIKIIVTMDFLFMGKSILTRGILWKYFWDNIENDMFKFFWGHGTNDPMRDIFGYGFHNIYLGIWYDIGLIGLLLFTGFILWNIRGVYKKNAKVDMFTIYGMIGFMTFQISDFFAITFTGPLVTWNYVILGFIAMSHKRKDRL